jgi:hypothetical protein
MRWAWTYIPFPPGGGGSTVLHSSPGLFVSVRPFAKRAKADPLGVRPSWHSHRGFHRQLDGPWLVFPVSRANKQTGAEVYTLLPSTCDCTTPPPFSPPRHINVQVHSLVSAFWTPSVCQDNSAGEGLSICSCIALGTKVFLVINERQQVRLRYHFFSAVSIPQAPEPRSRSPWPVRSKFPCPGSTPTPRQGAEHRGHASPNCHPPNIY